jgi:hypothetical protein
VDVKDKEKTKFFLATCKAKKIQKWRKTKRNEAVRSAEQA